MSRDLTTYVIRIAGYEQAVEFDCESELEAVLIALSAHTPMGHGLWLGDRFIAWVEPAPPEELPRPTGPSPIA